MDHIYESIEGWFTFPNLYKNVVEQFDNAHFVEVGAWMGRSAAFMAVEIINSNKSIKFDVIDTWKGSVEHSTYNDVREGLLYEKFLKNIEPVKHIINPVRDTSLNAVSLYNDKSLDFVFIDASHQFEDVYADIKAWYPKVKKGGILSGHDYDPLHWPGVTKAVDTFTSEHNITLDINSEGCWGFYINA